MLGRIGNRLRSAPRGLALALGALVVALLVGLALLVAPLDGFLGDLVQSAVGERSATVPTDIRTDLSRALAGVDAYYSRQVSNPSTRLGEVPASFLNKYRIYRVEYFAPSKPGLFYVGYAPGGRAYLLTAHPENYIRVSQTERVTIASRVLAAEYASIYLDVTQTFSELRYTVNSVDDLMFRPKLETGQEQVKAATIAKYRDVIQPPSARADGQDYVVTAYVVRQQNLERHQLSVSRNGDVKDNVTVLERDLPLVYGL